MTFDDTARARIARGWLNSSLDQPTYAAKHGISTRTLRLWVEKYGPGDRPAARARAIISSAIDQLHALQAALDADEACLAGTQDDGDHEVPREAEERHAASETPTTVGHMNVPEAEPARPTPMPLPRDGFLWC